MEPEIQLDDELVRSPEQYEKQSAIELSLERSETYNKKKETAVNDLQKQVEKMRNASNKKYPSLKKGDNVTVPVPEFYRNKGDSRNLIGIVMEVTADSFYKIGTKEGISLELYDRN